MTIKDIKQRYEKSTPGEWKWEETEDQKNHEEWGNLGKILCVDNEKILGAFGYDCSFVEVSKTDADFIAHAHQDIPLLLEAIKKLNRRLQNNTR